MYRMKSWDICAHGCKASVCTPEHGKRHLLLLCIASFLHWMHIVVSVVQIQPYFVQTKAV